MLFHGLVPFRGHRMDDFLISFGSHEFWHQRWAAGILHRAIQLKPEGNFWKDLVSEIRTATTCGKKREMAELLPMQFPSLHVGLIVCCCLVFVFGFCLVLVSVTRVCVGRVFHCVLVSLFPWRSPVSLL